MKYKAGDKVRIKSLDWYTSNKNKFGKVWTESLDGESQICFDSDMILYCGMETVIFSVERENYVLKGIPYAWTDEMIECKVVEETQPKFKVGDRVITNKGYIGKFEGWVSDYQVRVLFEESGCNVVIHPKNLKLVEEETKNWADTSIPDGPYTVTYDSPSMNDSMNKNNINNEIILPDGYIFKDENGNVINATKIVFEKKKKEYDKGTKVRHKTKGMVEIVIGLCKIKYMGAWVDGVIYEGNDTNTGEPTTFVRVKEDFENNFEVL